MKNIYHSIILARGGSKGIKNKNLQIINNKPLIYWSIKKSLECKRIARTWVSSDSKKILELSKNLEQILLKDQKFILKITLHQSLHGNMQSNILTKKKYLIM